MTIFDDSDIPYIKKSIMYFNSLSDQTKAQIIGDLRPSNALVGKNTDLLPLLNAIAKMIRQRPTMTISNELIELGLDETYAALIVKNMKKHYPQLESLLLDINSIDDKKFSTLLPEIMKILLTPTLQNNMDVLNCTDIEYNTLKNILAMLLNATCRGEDLSASKIIIQKQLNNEKSKILFEVIAKNEEYWHKSIIFLNSQDILFVELQTIKKDLVEIKAMINNLTKLITMR